MDVEDYYGIRARSSTEELNHSGFRSNVQDFKIYMMFNMEPVQCSQNWASVVIFPGSCKDPSRCILNNLN